MILFLGMTIISMLFAKASINARDNLVSNNTQYVFAILSLLPFILVAAFRNEVGTDWNIYVKYFETINANGETFNEIGFNIINRIAYLISDNFMVLIAMVAVITYSFIFKAIYDQSVIVPLSILIYVISSDFFISLNQMRQAIAIAIFLYSLKYVYKRKPIQFFLWIAIAATMHVSALFYLPVYFMYNKKINLKFQIIFLLSNIILLPIISKIMRVIISKTRYDWYFGSIYDTNNFYLLGIVFGVVVLSIYLFYYYNNQDKTDAKYNLMTNMYYISILLLLYSAAIPQVIRISTSYAAINCLLVPRLIAKEKDKTRRVVLYIIIFVIFTVKLLYDIFINDWYLSAPPLPGF